jgi:hypothetical protein
VPKAVESFEETEGDVCFAATSKEKESTIIGESEKPESFMP